MGVSQQGARLLKQKQIRAVHLEQIPDVLQQHVDLAIHIAHGRLYKLGRHNCRYLLKPPLKLDPLLGLSSFRDVAGRTQNSKNLVPAVQQRGDNCLGPDGCTVLAGLFQLQAAFWKGFAGGDICLDLLQDTGVYGQ